MVLGYIGYLDRYMDMGHTIQGMNGMNHTPRMSTHTKERYCVVKDTYIHQDDF
jgi:hypothetical protein